MTRAAQNKADAARDLVGTKLANGATALVFAWTEQATFVLGVLPANVGLPFAVWRIDPHTGVTLNGDYHASLTAAIEAMRQRAHIPAEIAL